MTCLKVLSYQRKFFRPTTFPQSASSVVPPGDYSEKKEGLLLSSLARRQRYGDIRLLLQCIQKSRFGSDSLNDEIIMAAIKVLANLTRESKQVDELVQLLTSEHSKIKVLVSCGKLKNAYLIAIKSRLVEEVRNISEIAGKAVAC